MRVTIPIENLKDVLDRGVMPLMDDPAAGGMKGFGRLEYKNDRLTIQSMGEVTACHSFCAVDDNSGEEGYCSVSLVDLVEMLKFMKSGKEIILDHRTTNEDIAGKLHVKSGKNSFVVPCVYKDLYARLPEIEGEDLFSVDRDELVNSVKSISFAGNIHHAERIYSNVCVKSCGGSLFIGSSNNLHCCFVRLKECDIDHTLLIPIKCARKLNKYLQEGTVYFIDSKKHFYLKQENGWIRFSKTENPGKHFPEFDKVMNFTAGDSINVSAEHFLNANTACKKVNDVESLMRVKSGEMELMSKNSMNGSESSFLVACDENSSDIEVDMAYCPSFSQGFLQAIKTGCVSITFSNKFNNNGWPKRVIMRSDNCYYLMSSLVCVKSVFN